MFLSGLAGIPQDDEVFSNHVSYVSSWLKCLENDANFLFKASADANRASEFILKLAEK